MTTGRRQNRETPHETAVAGRMIEDTWSRVLRYLRVSVTDRCNYTCHYCHPISEWHPVSRDSVLSFEEIVRIVEILVPHGVRKVRLTGGEPLLRKNICELVHRLSRIPGMGEVAMTTNGHLLSRFADQLYAAGLRRLTVSLDTLDENEFARITGGDLNRVLEGVSAAKNAGFEDIGINVVALQSVNRYRLYELAQFCWSNGWTPRFIELMPIGDLPFQSPTQRIEASEILDEMRAGAAFEMESFGGRTAFSGPARYYRVVDGPAHGHRFGVISPMSDEHFVRTQLSVRFRVDFGVALEMTTKCR